MRPVRLMLIGALCLSGCTDSVTTPPALNTQARSAIVDAASGGNPHFFFLPPVARTAEYSGTFDGSLSASVRVSVDGAVLAELPATVDEEDELYQANWHTNNQALPAGTVCHLVVRAEDHELGSADVVLVGNGKQRRNHRSDDLVVVKDGATLAIKFRIEEGAIPSGPEGLVMALDAEHGLQDSSGRGGEATAVNVSIVNAPWGGHAFKFDGDGELILPDLSGLVDFTSEFTIELTAQPSTDDYGILIGKGQFGPLLFSLGYGADLEPHTGYHFSCGPYTEGATAPYLNQVKKLTLIVSGDALAFFLNNNYTAPAHDDAWAWCRVNNLSTERVRVGAGPSPAPNSRGDGNYFHGLIDNIRIFNRALTPDELSPVPQVGGSPGM